MQIVEKKINDIKPYEKNPRKNDEAVEYVAKSIREFGFKVPIVIDKNGIIVAGHTRHKAAKQLGLKTVPCIIADDLSEEQIKAFRLVDNKTSEFAEWDYEALNYELDDIFNIDMEDFGFDINLKNELEQDIVEDEPPEIDEDSETICKLGDIWQLGNHKLLCGDSTDRKQIERLMNGEKADMVFTDPPYGMGKENEGIKNDNLNYDDLLEFNKKWIHLSLEFTKENGSWYCFGTDEPLMDIYSEILKPLKRDKKENRITFRNLITWDKGSGQGQLSADYRMYAIADEKILFIMKGEQGFNTNADNYFEGWEPIRDYLLKSRLAMGWDVPTMKRIVGHSDISRDHWTGKSQFNLPTEKVYNTLKAEAERQRQKKGIKNDAFKREYDDIKREYYATRAYFDNTHDNMNNVWHFSKTSAEERKQTGGHATPKPIALCCRAIKTSSREGETVLDLFGGSGSTLIACEQLDRKCYMMELSEKYCDVILKRWETFTGKKAVKINVEN